MEERKGPVKYALYDYSLYKAISLNPKGWAKRARKIRTMSRKNYGNTKCTIFGENVSRKRVLMKLISIYRRMPSFSLKSLTDFKMLNGKKIKGKVKIVG